jgi:hypothetical protein
LRDSLERAARASQAIRRVRIERRLGLPARPPAPYRRPIRRPVSWARITIAVLAFYAALGGAVLALVR